MCPLETLGETLHNAVMDLALGQVDHAAILPESLMVQRKIRHFLKSVRKDIGNNMTWWTQPYPSETVRIILTNFQRTFADTRHREALLRSIKYGAHKRLAAWEAVLELAQNKTVNLDNLQTIVQAARYHSGKAWITHKSLQR